MTERLYGRYFFLESSTSPLVRFGTADAVPQMQVIVPPNEIWRVFIRDNLICSLWGDGSVTFCGFDGKRALPSYALSPGFYLQELQLSSALPRSMSVCGFPGGGKRWVGRTLRLTNGAWVSADTRGTSASKPMGFIDSEAIWSVKPGRERFLISAPVPVPRSGDRVWIR